MELTSKKRHQIETDAKRMMECLKAIFLLAGIEIKSFHQLPNGYCGDLCCPHRPWMLAETKYGLIRIGWRKSVISIEWPNSVVTISGKAVKPKADEWVTDLGDGGVHAWGYAKAVEYLSEFRRLAEQALAIKEGDANLSKEELKEYRELSAQYKVEIGAFDNDKHARLTELVSKRNKTGVNSPS